MSSTVTTMPLIKFLRVSFDRTLSPDWKINASNVATMYDDIQNSILDSANESRVINGPSFFADELEMRTRPFHVIDEELFANKHHFRVFSNFCERSVFRRDDRSENGVVRNREMVVRMYLTTDFRKFVCFVSYISRDEMDFAQSCRVAPKSTVFSVPIEGEDGRPVSYADVAHLRRYLDGLNLTFDHLYNIRCHSDDFDWPVWRNTYSIEPFNAAHLKMFTANDNTFSHQNPFSLLSCD